MTEIAELKHTLRKSVRAARRAMGEDQRATSRTYLTERLIELVLSRGARSLSCFLPTTFEPDTRPFLAWAARQGIDTLLPSSRPDGSLGWIRPSGQGEVRGAHSISEPIGELLEPAAIKDVDLMLIPAAAVDIRGNRLGWGRGYFDRSLSLLNEHTSVYAVVFDMELQRKLPTEAHDVPVAGAVTPSRIVTF